MSGNGHQTEDENATVNTTGGGFGSQKDFHSTDVIGPANKYKSDAWDYLIPTFMMRYLPRFLIKIYSGVVGTDNKVSRLFNITVPSLGPSDKVYSETLSSRAKNNLYSIIVGTLVGAVTTLFALRNLHDIHHMFAGAVGYEFEKDEKEVGRKDFFDSKNDIVEKTRHNYMSRNFWRYVIVGSFFSFFAIPNKVMQKEGADTVDLGVSLAGIRLVTDLFSRKESFFEMMQRITDAKVNHNDKRGDPITTEDVMNLYDCRMRATHKNYSTPKMNSEKWENDKKLAERIANLLNQSYDNVKKTEPNVDLDFRKLIYLWGHKLLDSDNFAHNIGFVELAGKSKNMKEVKQVVNDLKNGVKLEEAFAKFGIDVSQYKTVKQDEELAAASTQKIWQNAVKNPVEDQGLVRDQATSNFMQNIKQKTAMTPPPPSYIGKESTRPETATGQAV
ncbi:MAG: hypothetical protein WCL30_02415 [Pseudomonadota bacterium]